jgi:hypothetical protein
MFDAISEAVHRNDIYNEEAKPKSQYGQHKIPKK